MKSKKATISQVLIVLVLLAIYWFVNKPSSQGIPDNNDEQIELLEHLYSNKISKRMIKLSGVNIKNLADDLKAPRHQKFIMQVNPEFSILVTHNIDLAPRINSLSEGDLVEVYGQYEWNHKGGLLHWTHHDPKGRRQGGWIIHNGKKYE